MSYKTRDSTERDLKYSENEHDFLILLSGSEKKVLEFGPAPEYVSKALKERHCHVTSIEKNAILAKQAKQFVDRTIVADIETTNLSEILGYEKYDVILLSNFLERLKEPLQLLKKLSKFLSKNGHIVCSIPNIAHVTIRLKLLDGQFKYEKNGLPDEAHLRFFTLNTILDILASSGYSITQLYRIKEDINLAYRTDLKHYTIPEELIESILRDPESTTLKYVFSATPTFNTDTTTRKWLMEFSSDVTMNRLNEIFQYYKENSATGQLESHIAFLQSTLKERDEHVAFLQSTLKDRDEHIANVESVVKERDEHIAFLQSTLKDREKHIESVEATLNGIYQTFAWRVLRKYYNIPRRIISKIKRK